MREEADRLLRSPAVVVPEGAIDLLLQRRGLVGWESRLLHRLRQPVGHSRDHLRLLQMLAAVGGVPDDEVVAVAFAAVDPPEGLQQGVAQPECGRIVACGVAGETVGQACLRREVGDEHRARRVRLVLGRDVLGVERLVVPAVVRHAPEEIRPVDQDLPELVRATRPGDDETHPDDGELVRLLGLLHP